MKVDMPYVGYIWGRLLIPQSFARICEVLVHALGVRYVSVEAGETLRETQITPRHTACDRERILTRTRGSRALNP